MKAIRRTKLKPGVATEMEVLKKLAHRNVIRLHEIINDPTNDEIFLIMDFLGGGTLQEKLQERGVGFDEQSTREYFRQLISAVHYCHEVANIAHRDIKPENMMLND
jgi:serine/threonine protein kinase